MSQKTDIDEALDALDGSGIAEVLGDDGGVEVDCAEVGPIGVRINRLRVTRDKEIDIAREAESLPERARSLGEQVRPIEVDTTLGGATLRTDPKDIDDGEYFEIEVRPRHTEVRRVRVGEAGERQPTDFSVTRRQLRKLIDEVRTESPH